MLFSFYYFFLQIFSQKKNSISLIGNHSKLYAYYTYGKFKKNIQIKENPSLTYLRKINESENMYLGLSIGLRTYFFNEYDWQTATETYNRYSNLNTSLNFRKEDYPGRRNKILAEIGLGLNTGINAEIINYSDTELPSKKLGSSLQTTVYGRYQYVLNNKWKFEIGFLGQNDILSSMFINERKVKFVTSTFVSTLNYSF